MAIIDIIGIITVIILILIMPLISKKITELGNKKQHLEDEILHFSAKLQDINQNIAIRNKDLNILKDQVKSCEEEFSKKNELLRQVSNNLNSTYENQKEILQIKLENFHKQHLTVLNDEYDSVLDDLTTYAKQLYQKIENEQAQLQNLADKQSAYIKEQQRKEQMKEQENYYKLVLSEDEIKDISFLRDIQYNLKKKEIIDKLIWENFYKPAYDILSSHLFTEGKKCGIYKITCLETNKAYIGQSVDIKERFKTHIKTALNHGSTSNKLYQEMKKYGLYNFTFEVLDFTHKNQLNEREAYWIDFYKTKEYGLNSKSGNN